MRDPGGSGVSERRTGKKAPVIHWKNQKSQKIIERTCKGWGIY